MITSYKDHLKDERQWIWVCRWLCSPLPLIQSPSKEGTRVYLKLSRSLIFGPATLVWSGSLLKMPCSRPYPDSTKSNLHLSKISSSLSTHYNWGSSGLIQESVVSYQWPAVTYNIHILRSTTIPIPLFPPQVHLWPVSRNFNLQYSFFHPLPLPVSHTKHIPVHMRKAQ